MKINHQPSHPIFRRLSWPLIRLPQIILLSACGLLTACDSNTPSATVEDAQTNGTQTGNTQTDSTQTDSLHISGRVQERLPLAASEVHLRDQAGISWLAHTDAAGNYSLTLPATVSFPLRAFAVSEAGRLEDCPRNNLLRPICLASVLTESDAGALTLNINPLTDRIASDIAQLLSLQGPQQLVTAKDFSLESQALETILNHQRAGFSAALIALGHTAAADFNPVTDASIHAGKLDGLFELLRHNRTYDNNSGATGHTTLSDSRFQPIVGFSHGGAYEAFDLERARAQQQKIEQARTRIFIVGDSTSSMYETLRTPRMGWGDAFAQRFNDKAEVVVVVGSRAGRSSRDFYNGRWFAQMEPYIRAGDYIFINHGHNDQNCDSAREIRGTADVENLCTYPNTDAGAAQFPDGQPELSFDNSLMRYVNIARARGAHPIMFTPTTRIVNAERKQALPVSEMHFTEASPGKNYAFTGSYANSIRQIAAREALPLIDLERASITFANSLTGNEWHDYWLVVPESVNPFYTDTTAGSPARPDGTHFQARGAKVIAGLVDDMIAGDATAPAEASANNTPTSAAPGSLNHLRQLLDTAQ